MGGGRERERGREEGKRRGGRGRRKEERGRGRQGGKMDEPRFLETRDKENDKRGEAGSAEDPRGTCLPVEAYKVSV